MKICVTAAGTEWSAATQPNFGRVPYFLLIDSETEAIEAVANHAGAHGAGVQAAQIVSEQGAAVVVTGSVGPNAFQGLDAAGIGVYVGASGTVREAYDAYRAGHLQRAAMATRMAHRGGRR
jgi:predicted Fe-Mo cluster-binding NifX family protein